MKKFDVNSVDFMSCTMYEMFCYKYACLVNKYRKCIYVYDFMNILTDIGGDFYSIAANEVSFKTLTSVQADELWNRYNKLKRRVMHRICNDLTAKVKKSKM